jgi:ornithine cyclodeaminase/alanine dehydrogenase-like protein (mu-crystallin family)
VIPFFGEAQVRSVLRMEDLLPAMERALIDFSAGRIAQPVRELLPVEPHGGYFAAMPAAGASEVGAKLVAFYPGNAAHGLPTHLAMILLFRAETGEPLAIMDGRLITEMRTSAVSAVATRALAAQDARVLAILGTGVQARSHVEALRLVRDFEEIRVWGRTREHAERFAADVSAKVMGAEQAVRDADVVVTATSSAEPVLRGAWLKPGALVNAVGWRGHKSRELDDDVMRNIIVVDSRAAALKEAGDLILTGAEIHSELGEILAGAKSPPRGLTTVFRAVGLAVEDVAAANLVFNLLQSNPEIRP